ncbi:39S ribosomal protein L54, mitochondrial-like [Homalodisca vitripennis]|uniref:Large ribosomal subunit protein mL54 n=1 Tax=Homalodisca liturata TaxID=320908 RepID=A0A1B6IH90_9HEMI|nr:39S ribosomal protein L54, mitochondrial-like [Homalodisca vitripennis]XP_046688852.1 39S ribosomal protein L54, mitochondrial-like [Homalodisca vitripennis]
MVIHQTLLKQIFIPRSSILNLVQLQACQYATGAIASLGKSKKLKGKAGGASFEKIRLPVETDAKKLVTHLCGSNLLAEGGEDIELKPDSEYPDWLWNLYIGKTKSLSELDPETIEYWHKLRALAIKHQHNLKSLRRF